MGQVYQASGLKKLSHKANNNVHNLVLKGG